MDKNALKFVLEVLPDSRTVFHDFADRYAVVLLRHNLGSEPVPIADLKKSHLAPLLSKPIVRQTLADIGRPWLLADDFRNVWPVETDAYRLTLSTWPSLSRKPKRTWHQVTRTGWSLVLQLNLPVSHRRSLDSTVSDWENQMGYSPHPVADLPELTLAWARLDLDFDTNEALIEEIQSDWVKDVKLWASCRWDENHKAWNEYFDEYLKPRARKWPETMLTATLWFLLEELGIRTVLYHTHDSGARLKSIAGGEPPRSLYVDLPRKFCFRSTHYGPRFLRDSKDKDLKRLFVDPDTKWFIHDFS